MSFGDLLGQIMQQGLGAGSPTRDRLQTTGRTLDETSSSGVGGLLEQLKGALGGAGGGAAGGFADQAQDFLRGKQVGSLSGAQVGGIGALAGALLGGGLGGAAKGGAMAVLGTLALAALKRAQQGGEASAPLQATAEDIRTITDPAAERVLLRAMISAAKADGQIDQQEMQAIVTRLAEDSVTPEEKQFVLAEMAAPLDVNALAREATTPALAAQIYAASLLAIHADTDSERAYLDELARALNLDAATVAELHRATGTPASA